MLLKTIIISIILVALLVMALGVKLLFDGNADVKLHSCAFDDNSMNEEDGACGKCDLKDLANCSENNAKGSSL